MVDQLNLKEMDWFSDLPDDALTRIRGTLRRCEFSQGQLILARGDPGDSVLFVALGRVLAVHWTETGREIVYSDIGPGSAFGELSVLVGGKRSLSLYARNDCLLYEMPGEFFCELVETQPQMRRALIRGLVGRVHELTERVHELTSLGVEERLRAYLLRLALEQGALEPGRRITDLPTHAEIANIIGANREAVSRGFAKLTRDGVIETGRKFLLLREPDRLVGADGAEAGA